MILRSPTEDENGTSPEPSHSRTVILSEAKDLLCVFYPLKTEKADSSSLCSSE